MHICLKASKFPIADDSLGSSHREHGDEIRREVGRILLSAPSILCVPHELCWMAYINSQIFPPVPGPALTLHFLVSPNYYALLIYVYDRLTSALSLV